MNKKIQIIFDFDGVILNSHNIKTEGFYFVFKKFGHIVAKKAQNYHKKNIGISRLKKFKFIKKKYFKNKELSIESLDKNFKKYCLNRINVLKVNAHLLKFLHKKTKKYDLFISTGTPEKEIIHILKNKKIFNYFKKVFGSPSTKIEHINKIKNKYQKRIFIGDSKEDYLSSKKTKTLFILREHKENKKEFKNIKVPKIINFINLNKIILKILKN